MLQKFPKLFEAFDETKIFTDINDAIEYYNVCLFIQNDLWLTTWSEEFREELKSLVKPMLGNIARFFVSINDGNFNDLTSQVDNGYVDDYLCLLCKFDTIKKISLGSFLIAMQSKPIYLYQVLLHKKIVDQYSENLRNTILSSPSNAELILSDLSASMSPKSPKYYPKELTDADINSLFLKYINSSEPNMNYLKQIVNYRNGSSIYRITKDLQYAAKQQLEIMTAEFFENQPGHKVQCVVDFYPQQDHKLINMEGMKCTFSYDSNWIKDNLDNITLLNNFIYLFEFLDRQFRITTLSNPNSAPVLERLIGGRNESDYFVNTPFGINNMVAELQLRRYIMELQKYGVLLEVVLDWYYTVYLEQEFGIKDFHISLPSGDKSYLEKCKSIAPEFESILKQYTSLQKFKKIDHQYIENVNPAILYTNLPSLCENNYAYAKSNEIKFAMHHLFSDQSLCFYMEALGSENENCLIDQIRKHQIKYSGFTHWQIPIIDELIKLSILHKTPDDGIIQVVDYHVVIILKQLYDFGFVSTLNYPDEMKLVLDDLINHDHINTSSSLLSVQEGNYFNFYLNDLEYGNALRLRNKYAHGTPSDNNEADYFKFLRLLVLLTLKIDNDQRNSSRFVIEKKADNKPAGSV